MTMPMPSPFEIGRSVGSNVGGAFLGASQSKDINQILQQAQSAQTPEEQINIMGQVLSRVAPERRPEVMDFLKQRYQMSREQGALRQFMGSGQPQDQMQRPQQKQQPAQGQPGAPAMAVQVPAQAGIQQPVAQATQPPIASPDFLSGDPNAIDDRARQLIMNQPYRYRDPETARAAAQQEYAAQQDVLNKTDTALEKSLSTMLQKQGTDVYKDIIGEMKEEYQDKARKMAIQGKMSPEQIARKLSTELLDFAKTRKNLEASTIPALLGTGLSGKDAQSKLRTIRKDYADKDRLELFEDDLVNKTGLSTGVASLVAFPIGSNQEISRFARDTKRKFSLSDIAGQAFTGIRDADKGGVKKRTSSEIGDFVSKNLKPSDSLTAIATYFNAKGYDPQEILTVIQNKWDEGKISLTKRQQRDLQKRTTFGATLMDLAYFSGTGLNPMEIVDERRNNR